MYEGYLEIGGVPIVNAEAVEAYVANLAPNMSLRPRFRTESIHLANEEPRYRSPVLDEQPWVNLLDPATHGFYGVYPLSIEGVDDSTLSADVVEHLNAGGSILSSREASRSIRVSGLLVGADKLAVQAGLTWLRAAVRGDDCATCDSGQMRYFLSEPDVCEKAFGAVVETRRKAFGAVQPTTIRYAFQSADDVDPAMPSEVIWAGDFTEGSSVSWGATELRTTALVETHGPVTPLRRNYLPNPTFRTTINQWAPTTASIRATWYAGNGDGYLTISPQTLVGDPNPYGTGAYGSGTYSSSETAGSVAAVTPDAVPAGPVVLSLDLRAADPTNVTVTLFDHLTSTVIGSTTVTPGADWGRVVVQATHPAAAVIRVDIRTSNNADVDVDRGLLEVGSTDLGYFDGQDAPEQSVAQWSGVPDASTATARWTGELVVQRGDSNFRPFITIESGSATALDLTWAVREQIDMTTQLLPYERFFYEVGCTQGPQVISVNDLGNHGYYMQVDFVFAAGNPYSYGSQVPIPVAALTTAAFVDPAPARAADDGWLVDPDCVAPTAPPAAPVILGNCIDNVTTWQRYYVPIPADQVGDWAGSVPVITINSLGEAVKQVRVRFHPNPFSYSVTQVDPLAFCSEFVLSYLPGSATLTVNGISKQVQAAKAGKATVSANHLLYGSNGTPVTWPELSCAVPYVMTLDVPSPADRDLFEIELALARKE